MPYPREGRLNSLLDKNYHLLNDIHNGSRGFVVEETM